LFSFFFPSNFHLNREKIVFEISDEMLQDIDKDDSAKEQEEASVSKGSLDFPTHCELVKNEEGVFLVHHIAPHDTLIGVALKYGVTVTLSTLLTWLHIICPLIS